MAFVVHAVSMFIPVAHAALTHLSVVFNGVPSSCFPSSTGLGSSFDVELAAEVGKALADECRAKGMRSYLSPTLNTVH